MIRKMVAACLAATALGGSPSLAGMMIGIQFVQGGPALPSSTVAGVVPQSNYNIVTVVEEAGADGTTGPLTAADGSATGVTLTHDSNDAYTSYTGTTTPNGMLLHGEDKTGPAGGSYALGPTPTATYTFNNLPSGTYDLIAYTEDEWSDVTANLAVGSTTYCIIDQYVPSGTPAFVLADSTNPDNRDVGNYVEFFNVDPVDGTITLTNQGEGGGDDTASINGLQIMSAVPEPDSLLLSICSTLTLSLLRRRRVASHANRSKNCRWSSSVHVLRLNHCACHS
jgi:hypothetical protein